jgi:hypothetical protein
MKKQNLNNLNCSVESIKGSAIFSIAFFKFKEFEKRIASKVNLK